MWFTTELPFTYSPARDVTPPTGVVLRLESATEQYVATRLDSKPVPDLRPAPDARAVSTEELTEIRKKAQADFMRHLVDSVK